MQQHCCSTAPALPADWMLSGSGVVNWSPSRQSVNGKTVWVLTLISKLSLYFFSTMLAVSKTVLTFSDKAGAYTIRSPPIPPTPRPTACTLVTTRDPTELLLCSGFGLSRRRSQPGDAPYRLEDSSHSLDLFFNCSYSRNSPNVSDEVVTLSDKAEAYTAVE